MCVGSRRGVEAIYLYRGAIYACRVGIAGAMHLKNIIVYRLIMRREVVGKCFLKERHVTCVIYTQRTVFPIIHFVCNTYNNAEE